MVQDGGKGVKKLREGDMSMFGGYWIELSAYQGTL